MRPANKTEIKEIDPNVFRFNNIKDDVQNPRTEPIEPLLKSLKIIDL